MILTKEGIDRYFIFDIESGYPYEVTKEYYERYNKRMLDMFEALRPKFNSEYKGALIMGTPGSFDNSSSAEIFNNPDKYNLLSFDNTWESVPDTKLVNYFKPTHMPREFIKPEPLGDDDPMPTGKYKDVLMKDVPANHLMYIYENELCSERVKEYIVSNLDVIKQQAKADK